MKPQTFRSAVDWWFYVLAALVPLTLLPVLASGDPQALTVVLLIGVPACALPLWLLLSTRYEVTASRLDIRCGPARWQIRRDDIQRIEQSRSVLSAPALSLNRLCIHYKGGKQVLVSPADQGAFLAALDSQQPGT